MTQREENRSPTQDTAPRMIPVLGSCWLQIQQPFMVEKINPQKDLTEGQKTVSQQRKEEAMGQLPGTVNPAKRNDSPPEVST